MSRETTTRRRFQPRALVAGGLIAIACAHGAAQGDTASTAVEPVQLAGYTPQSALAFGSVPSVAAVSKALERSPLYRLYNNDEVQTFLKPAMGMMRGMMGQVKDFTGMTPAEIVELIKGRVDFSLMGLKQSNFGVQPILALSLQVSDAEKAMKLVNTMIEIARDEGMEVEDCKVAGASAYRAMVPIDVYLAMVRGSVVLTTDEGVLAKIVKNEQLPAAERLSASAAYGKVIGKTQASQAHAYVALNIREISKVAYAEMDERTAGQMKQIMAVTGFDTVDWIADSMRFNEFGVREMFYVHTGERKGMLQMLDSATPSVSMAKDMPGDSAFFYGLRVDPLKAYDAFRKGFVRLAEAMPDDVETDEIDEIFLRLESGDMGFKLREDILASLGDEMGISVGLPVGSPIPSFLMRMKLRNPQKVAELLAMASEKLPKDDVTVTKRTISGATAYVIRKTGGGFPVSPVITVIGDHLVVAPNVSMVRRVIKNRFQSRLTEEAPFQRAMKRMSAFTQRGATLFYIDLAKAIAYGYEALSPMLSTLEPDDLDVPLDLAMLPTTEAITEHFAHVIATDIIEKDGYMIVTESPIPLSVVQASALGAIWVMPMAMGQRRDAARAEIRRVRVARQAAEAPKAPTGPRPRVGVVIDDLPNGAGVRVAEIKDGSAASKSGLQVGDVIVAVDGQKITNGDPIEAALGKKRVGDQITFRVKRSNGSVAVVIVRL